MVSLLKSQRLRKFRPPVSGNNIKFWREAMLWYYAYNIFIVIIGASFIIWGINMIEKGVEGEINWIVKLFGNESSLYKATPGVFLIIVGLLIILFARGTTDYNSK